MDDSHKDSFSEEALLAASVLDTLLCVLVDTPDAVRRFEEIGGLGILVRTLKKSKVSRDVRYVSISERKTGTYLTLLQG
jgi:hypothetical protein